MFGWKGSIFVSFKLKLFKIQYLIQQFEIELNKLYLATMFESLVMGKENVKRVPIRLFISVGNSAVVFSHVGN